MRTLVALAACTLVLGAASAVAVGRAQSLAEAQAERAATIRAVDALEANAAMTGLAVFTPRLVDGYHDGRGKTYAEIREMMGGLVRYPDPGRRLALFAVVLSQAEKPI